MRTLQEVEGKLTSEERLTSLDLIRVFAILMILPANLTSFSHPPTLFQAELKWADKIFTALTVFFVYGKFITLLFILFGAGLAIQAKRAQSSGQSFERHYARRRLVLFLIGLIHALLLWYGDIYSSVPSGLAIFALDLLSGFGAVLRRVVVAHFEADIGTLSGSVCVHL